MEYAFPLGISVVLLLCATGMGIDSTLTDIVTVSHPDSSTTVWRIESPNVRQPESSYQQIRFHPGDVITVTAGGCVGTGNTWKSYVNPLGKDAARFYSGTIMIPAVIPAGAQGFQRIGGWVSIPGRPKMLTVPEHLPPTVHESELFLHLGYQDDKYSDNGYSNHDDGDLKQCLNIGAAWVEVKVVSGAFLAKAAVHRLASGINYSPHSRPFDLVWDTENGVDANGLPLNPIWEYQITHAGEEPDFRGTCRQAFPDDHSVNPAVLASVCTSQSPSTDFSHSISVCNASGVFNQQHLFSGHLNWSVTTYTGEVYWDEDSTDGDFNFDIMRPDRAALTNMNPTSGVYDGLHVEFNERETIANFRSPFWVNFRNNDGKAGSDALFGGAVNGRLAVVTGLHGIDGVHGGHSESHPVFAMAVQTSAPLATPGGQDESWAFFLRNRGGEGQCSRMQHDWSGLSDGGPGGNWYFIQMPWPEGATEVGLVTANSQIWINDSRIHGPWITRGQAWTYVGFQLPGPEGAPELDGQITLHYVISPVLRALGPMAQVKASAFSKSRGDDWEEVGQHIADPAARARFERSVHDTDMAVVHPAPHTIRLNVNPEIGIYRPLNTLARAGKLVPDHATLNPIVDQQRLDREQQILRTVPLNTLPMRKPPGLAVPR